MKRFQISISVFFITALIATVLLTACGSSSSASNTPDTSNIDAAALMSQQCTRCHPLSRVTSKTKTAEQWKVTVDRMIQHGAQLTPPEEQALVEYLAQNY